MAICYLCGEPRSDSRDHLPPKCLIPKNLKGRRITLNAHSACNGRFAADEEYLRNYVAVGANMLGGEYVEVLERARKSELKFSESEGEVGECMLGEGEKELRA